MSTTRGGRWGRSTASRGRSRRVSTRAEHEVSTSRDLGKELLADVTRVQSTVSDRDLHARAYELAAGHSHPRESESVLAGLARDGELDPAGKRQLDDTRAARARAADA